MDFKAKPKEKVASGECLVLLSLKMLIIYDITQACLMEGNDKQYFSGSIFFPGLLCDPTYMCHVSVVW